MKSFTQVACLGFSLFFSGFLFSPASAQPRTTADHYDRMFALPGIEFSETQMEKVNEIRNEYLPKIEANQKRWNQIPTQEQLQLRREAMQKSREKGVRGRELQTLVEAAVKETPEQRKERASTLGERNQLQTEIRSKLIELLTQEQQAKFANLRPDVKPVPATHANVKYGPHDRNVLDLWLAKSDQPTPVVISIHGGGFRGGRKSVNPGLLNECLASGISVVAITYRFSADAIAPASFRDSARAVQFLRHHAKKWNLNSAKFAATGSSAGAGISLWLGFHDEMADPKNEDPVLRESTRLSCMMVTAGQTSYDPRFIRKLFPGSDTYKHSALAQLFDVNLDQLDELPEEKYRLFEECSALPHLTKDDPPAMLSYGYSLNQEVTNGNIGIHHPRFGQALKEKMDALKIPCILHAGRDSSEGAERTSRIDFLKKHFGMTE